MFNFPISRGLRVQVAENKNLAAGDFLLARDMVEVGQTRLADVARPGMRVTIAFTDATRACPDEQLVGWLVAQLVALGINLAHITLLCATGLHRPSTVAERLAKLGTRLVEHLAIVDHQAMRATELLELGKIEGLPLVVNRRCVETDLLLATGIVEPHQYAGYSGGAKTVVIGCGGEATIEATHGPAMLDQSGTRLGAIADNPFQMFVRRAGARIGLAYVVNVLLNEAGAITAAAAGEPAAVHDYLVAQARQIYEAPVDRPAHLALAGVSAAKAVNLYQASRAATYLALADRSPLLPGAPIVMPAPIPEGAGQGTGEQRFYEILARAESPVQLIEELRRTGFPAGAQRAYILAQVLAQHPVIVVGAEHPQVVEACHMRATANLERGLALAEALARAYFAIPAPQPLDFLVVPHALLTLPKLVGV
jgi:nickel-dependent lactate racemase